MSNGNTEIQQLKVAIIGASGYGGAEIARLLSTHPNATLTVATASGERAGARLSDLFPHLRGICDIQCEEFNADAIAQKADFAFIALGHGKAMEIAPQLLERGLKVCDLGADFRLRDAAVYQQWYKLEHNATEALAEAVYGLPEWNREKIKNARLVANPGCYPTSAILALAPFVAMDYIDPSSIIVNSASGTSGAGRSSFGIGMHHPEVDADYKAYNVGKHRHTPEIEQGLMDAAALMGYDTNIQISFTPHLLPIARGILTTCYADIAGPFNDFANYASHISSHEKKSEADAVATFQALCHGGLLSNYEKEPFVRICKNGELPQIKHVVGSNFCDIGVIVDERTRRLIIVAAEDNLVKGAAGQAVQNMNIMSGFEETSGLKLAPIFP